jgi:hypothetical protein
LHRVKVRYLVDVAFGLRVAQVASKSSARQLRIHFEHGSKKSRGEPGGDAGLFQTQARLWFKVGRGGVDRGIDFSDMDKLKEIDDRDGA